MEGDDGIFAVVGDPPTKEDFAQLGFKIKITTSRSLGEVGFCTMFFDEEVLENVVDPAEMLAGFGWSHSMLSHSKPSVMAQLLRAKADSLCAEVPACPIAGSLVNYVRRCVGDGKRSFEGAGGRKNYWERYVLSHPNDVKKVDMRSRLLVEKLFNCSVSQQLCIEAYLDGLDEIRPLSCPSIDVLMRKDWCDYYDKFTCSCGPGQSFSW